MSCSQAARARYSRNQALLVRLELEDFKNEQARACSSSIYGARYTSLPQTVSLAMRTFTCHQIQSRKELIMRARWLWWWCIFQCSAITTGMQPPAELVLSETSTQNPY